ncbi:hypothetical protein WJR50_14240 [Catalinimonas sp. 4WD22]|uniref:tetratricopeptide repeat protein n=1 Tax=Catalinimonas locisalis TaxID=3133978 RepID=UPI003101A213
MTNDQYLKANFYLQSKKYNEGLKLVENLLPGSPQDDMLYAYQSLFFQGLMNLRKAEASIMKAIELNPVEYEHYKNATKIQLLSQNPEKGDKLITAALNLNPNDADLFGFRSVVYISRQEYKKAIQIANEGLKIDPNNSQSLRAKALALSFLHEKEEAEKIANELLKDNPINAQNLLTKGLVSLCDPKKNSKVELQSALAQQPYNLHIQNAYRVSLKSELPGFLYFKNWAVEIGKPESMPSKLIRIIYIGFLIFCIITLLREGIHAVWLMLYLVFWNLNLAIQLSVIVFLPIYDTWLFFLSRESRPLFTKHLKFKLLVMDCFILISTAFFILAVIFYSIDFYQIGLHTSSLLVLVHQIMYTKSISYRGWLIYLIIVIFCLVLSIYQFGEDTILFIVFNIIFRALSMMYHKMKAMLTSAKIA